jgi:RHS repeat-associated protein
VALAVPGGITKTQNAGSYIQSALGNIWGQQQNSGGSYARSSNLATSQITGVWSVELLSSTTSNYQLNYGNPGSVSRDYPSYPSYFGLRGATGVTLSPTVSIQWIRSRILPPNGVMPQVTFGQAPTQSSHTILDANHNRLRTTLTTSDYAGRTIETQTLGPQNQLLYSTYSSYDNWGNMISSTDAIGHTTYYSYANTNFYNSFSGGTSSFTNSFYTNNTVISPHIHDALVGEAQLQNGAGSLQMETYYDYNTAGEMLHQKQLFINGTYDTWLYTTHAYDSYGNVIISIDPLGRSTTYQYSSTYGHAYLTNQSTVVNGKTISTTYTYNFATGWMTSQTDGNGQTTSYTYDNLGRETSVTYPAVGGVSAFTQYSYDDKNNIVNITDPDGNLVRQFYDGIGREIEVLTFNGSRSYSIEYYTYNYQNQVANHTLPSGSKYSYFYDALGRQTELMNPDGTTETTTYDTLLNSTMYDVVKTNENGYSTTDYYNWANELVLVQQPPVNGITYTTKYSYDQVGNLLSITDANNHVTTYQYDNLNRLTMTLYPDGTNSTNTYDAVGNLIKTKDPLGNIITNTYDSLNRLTQVQYPNGATVTYTYDADSNKLSTVQSSPATSSYYTYDARDRLTNETDVIAGVSYTTLYSYDKASNILSITYPDNSVLGYTYDALHRIKTVGNIANFTYTLDSKIATIGYGNNAKTTYTYDSRDRPKSIYSFSGSTQLMGLNYSYDGVGNVLKINTENYTYNSLNELISSRGPWGSTSYFYDGAGNMLNMTSGGATTTYGYDSYNRMTSAGSATLNYDANGNLIKVVNGSTTWQYSYDYENQLTGVAKDGATVQNNTYSGNGLRVKQTVASSNIAYTYLGADVLFEKNLTSSTVTKNCYANGLLLGEVVGSTSYYLLDDALGSIRDVTTATAGSVFSSNYKPYGPNYGLSETLSIFNFEYAHKPYDSSTGLYYYEARFYDPAIERFITEDSLRYSSIYDPLSLNKYLYVENNPETMFDPTGHDGWNPFASLSNWWNGLSPTDQFIVLTAIAVFAVAATVLTVGALAPVAAEAIGADVVVAGAVEAGEAATADAAPEVIDTAGTDIGASQVSNAVTDLSAGGTVTTGATETIRHLKKPFKDYH